MLSIVIRRSRRLTWLLILTHAGAVALLWPLVMALWIKMVVAVAIIASLAFFLNHVALLTTPEAVIAVEVHEQGKISLQTRRGEWHECRLSGDSFVSTWLTILVLAQENRRRTRHVVITPDNVDAGDFRRLRVWLRWADHRAAEPEGGP